MKYDMIDEEYFNTLTEEKQKEYGQVFIDTSKFDEQFKELGLIACAFDVNFLNLFKILFNSPIKFSPSGLVNRYVKSTPAGDRFIVLEFGAAGKEITAALRAYNSKI